MFSNGVVHHIDAVLMPSKLAGANAPAVGQPAANKALLKDRPITHFRTRNGSL